MDTPITLKRDLQAWHIFMIAVGSSIGIGWTKNGSQILAIAGPAGTLTAFGIVGIVSIMVMEGVCEMIVLWPISNAMIEFVKAFVDKDLGFVVGLTYWYTYCTTLAALIIGATDSLAYWDIKLTQQRLVYLGCIGITMTINLLGVKWFGWIEFAGGVIKVIALFCVFVGMLWVNYGGGEGPIVKGSLFNAGTGFFNNPNVAKTPMAALAVAIPIATFAYIGIEMLSVMAFEARRPQEMRFPSKYIAYCITAIYLMVIGSYVSNVEWFNQNLPKFLNQPLVGLDSGNLGSVPLDFPGNATRSNNAPVIAFLQASIPTIPGLITGFIFYSGISCATANLYVVSRTLYGLTRHMKQHDPDHPFKSKFAILNTVTTRTRVPFVCLIVSIIPAGILPFALQDDSKVTAEVQQILVAIGSVGCVLVWASQCLAYINYFRWLKKHKDKLVGPFAKYNRWPKRVNENGEVEYEDGEKRFRSWLAIAQPAPAAIGLVMCLVIVFVMNSASIWNGQDLQQKILTVYLGPGLQILLFIVLKLINGNEWLELGDWDGPNGLRATLIRLSALENRSPSGMHENNNAAPAVLEDNEVEVEVEPEFEDDEPVQPPPLSPSRQEHHQQQEQNYHQLNPNLDNYLDPNHLNKLTPSSSTSASRSIEPEPGAGNGIGAPGSQDFEMNELRIDPAAPGEHVRRRDDEYDDRSRRFPSRVVRSA